MATGTTQLNDMVAAELVAAKIYETARAASVGIGLVGFDSFRGSNVKSYTRFTKVTAGALTEGTDATVTDMSDTQVSATLGEIGIGALVLDTVDVASSVPQVAEEI